MDCIFCKITSHGAPADIIKESGEWMAFKDIKPSAPVHVLVVPKKHIDSVIALQDEDRGIISELVFAAKAIAANKGMLGYRLSFNVGRSGGQLVDHIHLHLLGGWREDKS